MAVMGKGGDQMGETESALDLILRNQAGVVQNLSAKTTEDADGEAVPSPSPAPISVRSDRISPETAEAIWKAMAQQMDQERQERQKLLEWFSAQMDQMRRADVEKDRQIRDLTHENFELKKQLAIQQTASEVLGRIFGPGRLYDIRGHPGGDKSAHSIRQRINRRRVRKLTADESFSEEQLAIIREAVAQGLEWKKLKVLCDPAMKAPAMRICLTYLMTR